jgi:hypothetical protein
MLAADESQSRRLLSNMHAFNWSIKSPEKASELAFDFVFVHPDVISKYSTDKMRIELLQS